MTITELIQAVGPEHIEIQNLQQNLDRADIRKSCGFITFCAEPSKVMDLNLNETSKFVGLVLWLPRSRMPEIKEPAPQPPLVSKPCPCGCITPDDQTQQPHRA